MHLSGSRSVYLVVGLCVILLLLFAGLSFDYLRGQQSGSTLLSGNDEIKIESEIPEIIESISINQNKINSDLNEISSGNITFIDTSNINTPPVEVDGINFTVSAKEGDQDVDFTLKVNNEVKTGYNLRKNGELVESNIYINPKVITEDPVNGKILAERYIYWSILKSLETSSPDYVPGYPGKRADQIFQQSINDDDVPVAIILAK